MTPDDIVALAARLRALEQVAYAADIFMQHVKGFQLTGPDGEPLTVMNEHMPEAIALQTALDAWHVQQAERKR